MSNTQGPNQPGKQNPDQKPAIDPKKGQQFGQGQQGQGGQKQGQQDQPGQKQFGKQDMQKDKDKNLGQKRPQTDKTEIEEDDEDMTKH